MKSNIDKAINYLKLYKLDHETSYLFDAKRMINRELKERKKPSSCNCKGHVKKYL